MTKDVKIYCNCMEEVLVRIGLIKRFGTKSLTTGDESFDLEFMLLQVRKVLELLAFASIAANKQEYSKVRAKFAYDWSAKKILGHLKTMNPEFYPQPLKLVSTSRLGAQTKHHLAPIRGGYLSEDEFEQLYDYCSDCLHTRNPYKDEPARHAGRSIADWTDRIETLLRLHQVRLLSGIVWVGAVPDKDGKVHTYTAEPIRPH